jgi:hypothetical protein
MSEWVSGLYAPKAVTNMMSPMGPGTKNRYPGETSSSYAASEWASTMVQQT